MFIATPYINKTQFVRRSISLVDVDVVVVIVVILFSDFDLLLFPSIQHIFTNDRCMCRFMKRTCEILIPERTLTFIMHKKIYAVTIFHRCYINLIISFASSSNKMCCHTTSFPVVAIWSEFFEGSRLPTAISIGFLHRWMLLYPNPYYIPNELFFFFQPKIFWMLFVEECYFARPISHQTINQPTPANNNNRSTLSMGTAIY